MRQVILYLPLVVAVMLTIGPDPGAALWIYLKKQFQRPFSLDQPEREPRHTDDGNPPSLGVPEQGPRHTDDGHPPTMIRPKPGPRHTNGGHPGATADDNDDDSARLVQLPTVVHGAYQPPTQRPLAPMQTHLPAHATANEAATNRAPVAPVVPVAPVAPAHPARASGAPPGGPDHRIGAGEGAGGGGGGDAVAAQAGGGDAEAGRAGPTRPLREAPRGPLLGPSQGPSQGPTGPPQGPPQGPSQGPKSPSQGPSQGPTGPPQGPSQGPKSPSQGPSQAPKGPSQGPPQGPSMGPMQGPAMGREMDDAEAGPRQPRALPPIRLPHKPSATSDQQYQALDV